MITRRPTTYQFLVSAESFWDIISPIGGKRACTVQRRGTVTTQLNTAVEFKGAIVIDGPPSGNCDIDLGPVIMAGWYHEDYENVIVRYLQTTGTSLLIVLPPVIAYTRMQL